MKENLNKTKLLISIMISLFPCNIMNNFQNLSHKAHLTCLKMQDMIDSMQPLLPQNYQAPTIDLENLPPQENSLTMQDYKEFIHMMYYSNEQLQQTLHTIAQHNELKQKTEMDIKKLTAITQHITTLQTIDAWNDYLLLHNAIVQECKKLVTTIQTYPALHEILHYCGQSILNQCAITLLKLRTSENNSMHETIKQIVQVYLDYRNIFQSFNVKKYDQIEALIAQTTS